MIELVKAIFMGVIQGITEFLPISSSGHLAILKQVLNMGDISDTFDVILHVGTLIAVFAVYWRDIWKLIVSGLGLMGDFFVNVKIFFVDNLINHREARYRRVINSAYRKFALLVIVSTIPTGLIGYFGRNLVEKAGTTLIVPGFCLLITGVVLLISDNLEGGVKTPKKTTYFDGIILGIVHGEGLGPEIGRAHV